MKHSARSKRLETEEKLRLLEKEQVRRRARKDISFFSENCFTPQFFGRQEEIKNPKHIKRWYRELQKPFRWRLQLAPRGSAKCIHPETLISLCNGEQKEARKCKRGDKIWSLNLQTLKIEADRIKKIWKTDKKQEVLTQIGKYPLKTSPDHKFLTIDGWKPISDIAINTKVAVPRTLELDTEKDLLSDDDVILLALLLAEGCLGSTTCTFTNTNPQIVEELTRLATKKGWGVHQLPCKVSYYLSKGTKQWARDFGINKLSKYKTIPNVIFRTSERQKKLFLNRFWACDGYVTSSHFENGRLQENCSIAITLASKKFVYQLYHLLLSCGYLSRIFAHKDGKFRSWSICINDNSIIKRFNSDIGFFLKSDRDKLNPILGDYKPGTTNHFDTVPKEIQKLVNLTPWTLRKKFGLRIDNRYDITRAKLERLALLDNNDRLLKFAKSDICWVKVSSKIVTENMVEMIDIETEKNANFVANETFVHNSYSHSIIYPLWRIIKNPDVRILICSSNASQAESFLRGIKGAIENDQLFNYYFPETMPVRPTLWTTSEIIVNRKSLERNPTVSTAGATGAIVSQRADLIIADDIIDDDNVITKNQREKVKAWFWKTMHPILVDGGQLLVCGTRWSPFDLYGELIKDWTALKDNEVKVTVDKAILDDEKKKVLWPEEMPYETLEKLRQQQPLFFRCSYQNEVAQLLESYFNIGDIKYFDPKEIDFSKLHIYMGVDPAISQADKGSYFAIVVVGLDDDQNIFVLHTYRAKVSIEQQVREIFARVRKFDPEGIGIDSSAYQDALRQIVETRKKEENLPIKVKRIYTRVDKFHKLLVLADKFESGKMFLRRDQHNLFEEIVSFPKGTNDLLDALHLAVDTSVERIKIGFELL